MNNEEKILEMLSALTQKVDGMDGRLDRLETTQTKQGEQLTKQGEQLTKQGEQLAYLTERVDEIDTRSLRSAVLLETEVARDVRLVYEGQEMLRQKMEELAPKGRVEAVEDDVAVLKDAYKLLRMEVNELKKAQ